MAEGQQTDQTLRDESIDPQQIDDENMRLLESELNN